MAFRLRAAAGNGLLLALAFLSVVTALELAFRLAPDRLLPAGVYGAGRRSEELGFNVHGSRVFYTKQRPGVWHDPNRDGFLDVDHPRAKPPGTIRIGFFGDSYVEAAQVRLEDAFFRQLAGRLDTRSAETLAFGVSGWGSVHGLRAFRVFGPVYEIDVAVYVFVENDPGDQSFELAAARGLGSNMPYAELSADGRGYRMRWTVAPGSEPWWFVPAKWLQHRSLLAHLVRDRLAILRQAGVRVRTSRADRAMTTRAVASPDPNDLPASWPAPVRARTQRLAELVLRDWRDDAARVGTRMLVLYVPRGEAQLRGEIPQDATWFPWLVGATARLGIPLLDPSDALRARLEAGVSVYGDHWTPAGHAVVAGFLADRLPAFFPSTAPSAAPADRLR